MSTNDDLLDHARQLDTADPLAHWRDEFVIDDPDLAYLDGNSLGMTPRRTVHRLHEVVNDEWAGGLISSWGHWLDLPMVIGDELAPLIGAVAGEVVVHDSTSVNLYQLLHIAVAVVEGCTTIVVPTGEFPTDRYLVDAVAETHNLKVSHAVDDAIAGRLGPVVVVMSLVDYRSAEVADMAAITAAVQNAGGTVIWDLSHAVGVLEVNLNHCNVDFAVGCTYKFLNGGPGAPGFSYMSTRALDATRNGPQQPIPGWFAQADQFRMDEPRRPRDDIGRLLIGTPGILGLTATRCGVELTATAGISAIAAKARAITDFVIEIADAHGLDVASPRDAQRRGGHVSIRHASAEQITADLAAAHSVLADYRDPDLIRLGCSPLTTRYVDVARAVNAIAALTA
ncbi:MAG: aminotransferase class V-fold PLP-dependent enzyme [Ilumatobacteraceae bacterium]